MRIVAETEGEEIERWESCSSRETACLDGEKDGEDREWCADRWSGEDVGDGSEGGGGRKAEECRGKCE